MGAMATIEAMAMETMDGSDNKGGDGNQAMVVGTVFLFVLFVCVFVC